MKIAFFQRAFHFRLDICLHAIILVQAFVVRDIRGRRRLFMCQLRKVRLIEQGVDVNRFGGEYVIYAYTEQTEEIIFAERGVMIDQLADQRQAGRNLRFDLVPQKQHKPVARKMSVRFVFLQNGGEYRGSEAFGVLRNILAEMILHVLEIMYVEAHHRIVKRAVIQNQPFGVFLELCVSAAFDHGIELLRLQLLFMLSVLFEEIKD